MLYFDAHCDILSAINKPEELFANSFHWDAARALDNGSIIQVFSSFAGDKFRSDPKSRMEAQIMKAIKLEKLYPDRLQLIRNREELSKAAAHLTKETGSKIYGFLEAEGAEILGGSITELERLYGLGLRVLTLVWNYDNEVCDSVAGNHIHRGLSDFGKMVVTRAQALGMLIDVSHSSDKTFDDVISMANKPITASHSNSRVLCPHRRNLTDEQIRQIAASGGVIGINFYPYFLEKAGNAAFLDIIRHIEYVASLAGIGSVGIGSDFDGFEELPQGMTGVEDLRRIPEELLRLNYSDSDVEMVMGGNFVRLFNKVL